jgi:hypothetical protein
MMNFVVHELVDVVFLGKPRDQLLFVLVYSPDKVTGYSGVKHVISLIGHNVYVSFVFAHNGIASSPSAPRNDGRRVARNDGRKVARNDGVFVWKLLIFET